MEERESKRAVALCPVCGKEFSFYPTSNMRTCCSRVCAQQKRWLEKKQRLEEWKW